MSTEPVKMTEINHNDNDNFIRCITETQIIQANQEHPALEVLPELLDPLSPTQPVVPKTELFVVTNDYPHIVYEKGSYYLLHLLSNSSSLLILTEGNRAHLINLDDIKKRNTRE